MTTPGPDGPEVSTPRTPEVSNSSELARNTAFDVGYAISKNKWSVAGLVMAITALLVAIVIQPSIWQSPDWRFVVPPSVVAIGLALCGLLVREPRWPLAVSAIAVAGGALVLGWVLIVIGVLVGFLIAAAILHQVV